MLKIIIYSEIRIRKIIERAKQGIVFIIMLLTLTTSVNAEFFQWPQGKRVAVSLTFDDARESQLDAAIPILDQHGIKATFYVLPENVKNRLSDWKAVAAQGHEIGNHSMVHPCSGNFVGKDRALENYTLYRMAQELDTANLAIQKMLGVRPMSFAYPCGQRFVGRGSDVKSYVPLIAETFFTGRGYPDEMDNDPLFCDFAQLMGRPVDGLSFDQVRSLIETASQKGHWLILAGHDTGGTGPQSVSTETLEAFCKYASDPENGIWVAPVVEVATYIVEHDSRTLNNGFVFVMPRRLYLGIMLMSGGLCFSLAFLLQRYSSLSVSRMLLLTGAISLLAISIWSIRYGYIGIRSFLVLYSVICFSAGCLMAILWKTFGPWNGRFSQITRDSR